MHYSFDFYDDKLCLDSFKLDTVLGRHGLVTVYITLAIHSKARHSAVTVLRAKLGRHSLLITVYSLWLCLIWLDLLGQA